MCIRGKHELGGPLLCTLTGASKESESGAAAAEDPLFFHSCQAGPFCSEVFLQSRECGPIFLPINNSARLKPVVEQGVDLKLIKSITGSAYIRIFFAVCTVLSAGPLA